MLPSVGTMLPNDTQCWHNVAQCYPMLPYVAQCYPMMPKVTQY
jgi:hypothetical protein